ncbi:uncharacterized protein BX663DRAFT_548884 [Cokeromyces recurvatus]|uniref:uncharacterized protein n=1 Tax=Cokeromyces recurvatus TaxID=90255 RepID=UPI002220D8D2|nr:uncharacterized protein BX663DRAFT_548884 [Cokeromyces recurvatus]KAI7906733.1 hypothetical protein BX663DRAFT_548884 [Cokeromyces recurvatus]
MYTKLVDDAIKGHYVESINTFDPPDEGGKWECPFCNPANVYKLNVPPILQIERRKRIKELIRNHVELHKKDLINQLFEGDIHSYEKMRAESLKRVRLWIKGTINDRELYKKDPLQN